MAWWTRKKEALNRTASAESKVSVPKGLWSKCDSCGDISQTEDLIANLRVCKACGHHHLQPTKERIGSVLDKGSWEELDTEIRSGDPLGFTDQKPYAERVEAAMKSSQYTDAFVSGMGRVDGVTVSVGFFAFEFMGGSMGSVVGEKVTRVLERAAERNCPAIVFNASGGARMQEGILSLMQMAKTSAARAKLRDVKLPYISVLLHPTTGGVAASFAFLGDVIVAEPNALIGFAGPRVIQQTIGQELPEGFQRSEFLLEHGMIDAIVSRIELRRYLGQVCRMLTNDLSSTAASSSAGQESPAPSA